MAQPIEEQLVGLDGMLYYQSTSANNGQLVITITFKLGTNPDIATVQTQNRVNVALPRLPPEVQRQGVLVKKVSTAFLMAVSLVASEDRYDALFLTNYAQINLVNQIGSLAGVGDSRLSSQQVYSMRVWLNPDKMAELGITATDVVERRTGAEPAEPGRRHRPGALAARNRFPIRGERSRAAWPTPASSTTSWCARSPTPPWCASATSAMWSWAR